MFHRRDPRNRRLPDEAYCDPHRVVYFTLRAAERSSPFATVRPTIPPSISFHAEMCRMVLGALNEVRDACGCDILVACLMPDHLHYLARPRHEASSVLTMTDQFKGKSTNLSWGLGHRGRLWQPRGFDRVVRGDESLHEKAEYIVNNPVRKAYVADWQAWPYTVRWDIPW